MDTETEELQKILGGGKFEVVEDGKQVANPRIDPGPMSFLIQMAQLGQLVKIRKYFDDRVSHGLIQTFGDIKVTDQVREIKFDYPAQSASIVNNGGKCVYVWVNTRLRPSHKMKRGETFDIGLETHKLNCVYLQCDPGETTNMRIVAND